MPCKRSCRMLDGAQAHYTMILAGVAWKDVATRRAVWRWRLTKAERCAAVISRASSRRARVVHAFGLWLVRTVCHCWHASQALRLSPRTAHVHGCSPLGCRPLGFGALGFSRAQIALAQRRRAHCRDCHGCRGRNTLHRPSYGPRPGPRSSVGASEPSSPASQPVPTYTSWSAAGPRSRAASATASRSTKARTGPERTPLQRLQQRALHSPSESARRLSYPGID